MLTSQEGTTQGDPLAMTMFALASVPLINAVKVQTSTQVWFADDASAGGRLRRLREWWDALLHIGPKYGYFPNAAKTHLLVKEEREAEAIELFGNTDVNISCAGKRYLGGALGTKEFERASLEECVSRWTREVEVLAAFAKTQPQASLAVFTHGLVGRWTYAFRVMSITAGNQLDRLEKVIASN